MIDTREDNIYNVLKYGKLSKYLPIRIVLRKSEDGKLKGLCEDSFSMSMSDRNVCIWWSGKAYSILGEHTLSGVKDAEHNAEEGDMVIDPLSDDCPVEIDWEKWITATTKYSQRNALFKVREVK